MAALLAALTNADMDGRVIVDGAAGTLRFVLLNAAAHFTKASLDRSLSSDSSWRRHQNATPSVSDVHALNSSVGLLLLPHDR